MPKVRVTLFTTHKPGSADAAPNHLHISLDQRAAIDLLAELARKVANGQPMHTIVLLGKVTLDEDESW